MPIDVKRDLTASEAARALSSDRGAYVLGGGTGLMRRIHEGDTGVRTLLRMAGDMGRIASDGGALRIGAQVTMAQIMADPATAMLHAAAASVGAPALRNMATVGGNLFARPPYGDVATALLALEAEVECATASGTDKRLLESLIADRTRRVVVAVRVPLRPGRRLAFHKMARSHPRGASIVTTAVAHGGGDVRVAFGGLAGRPVRAKGVERALGNRIEPRAIETAVARIGEGIAPFTDPLATGWYRHEMAQVQLRRLLTRIHEGDRA